MQSRCLPIRASRTSCRKGRSARIYTTYESWQGHGVLGRTLSPQGFKDFFKPYEDFQVIRYGQFVMAEMPFLAQAADAAIVWSNVQKVQIQLNGQNAVEAVKDVQAGVIYTVDEPPASEATADQGGTSTQFAEPGDTIDFTLRFDRAISRSTTSPSSTA